MQKFLSVTNKNVENIREVNRIKDFTEVSKNLVRYKSKNNFVKSSE